MEKTFIKKIKSIKRFFKNIPRLIEKRIFFVFLIFLVLPFILSVLVFYGYFVLAAKTKPAVEQKNVQFDKSGYDKFLNTLREREIKFKETDSKEYLDPFNIAPPASNKELK